MKYETVNKYSDAYLLRQPACKSPFASQQIIPLLTEAAEKVFPPDSRPSANSQTLTEIRLFQRFLEFSGVSKVAPGEALLEEFKNSPQNGFKNKTGQTYGLFAMNSAVDTIRRLFNDYFYPRRLIQRQILTKKVYTKYARFLRLTDVTQKLIISFEEDGRFISVRKKYFEDDKTGQEHFKLHIERKSQRLSDYNRKCYIDKTLTLLGMVRKNGVEELSKEDFEKCIRFYREKGKEDTGRSYVLAVYSLISNGIALGMLNKNPFNDYSLERRKHKSRKDFIMPDQMGKILDLKSLNWNSPDDVRKRCITLFAYDTGLRASTIAQLTKEDVHELPDGRYQIRVRGIFLKGEKEDKIIYVLFHQTIPILRCWIHVMRPQFNPKANRLFVSNRGQPLTRSGIRNIVRDCCKTLGIRTIKGKLPSPHTLRHTLATLNIEPFGKSLSPRLMQQRLIHIDLETLEKIYVHSNPLAEMEEYKKLLKKDTGPDVLSKMSREEFFALLDSLFSAKPGSVRDIKLAYDETCAKIMNKEDSKEGDKIISESEALSKLAVFEFDFRSLRRLAIREGFCRITGLKKGRRHAYVESIILDLLKNYVTVEEVLKRFQGSRSAFYYRLKRCKTKKIGRVTLILKDDFLKHLIPEAYPKKVSTHPRMVA